MTLASEEDGVVVSADTDFGALLAHSNRVKPSVVLFRRQQGGRARDLSELLLAHLDIVRDDLEAGAIVVIADARIRVRCLPIRSAEE